MITLFVLAVVYTLIFGGIGYSIGEPKGKGAEGFVWGFFLGVIGWVVTALIKPSIEVEAVRELQKEKIKSKIQQEKSNK